MIAESEEELLRSVALQNANSVLLAKQRAEQDLISSREALRLSEAKLKLGISVAGLGLCTIDYRNETIFLDEVSATLFLLEPNTPIPLGEFYSRLSASDGNSIPTGIAQELGPQGADSVKAEYRLLRGTHSPRWIKVNRQLDLETTATEAGGAATGLLVVYDVTAAKEREARLQISEARYRSVVEGSLQGIVIQQEGKIVYANQAMAQIFGYTQPEEMIGFSTFDDLVAHEDRSILRARTAAVYRGESVLPHPGWRGKHRDGRLLWVSSTAQPSDWHGRPAVASFYRDITGEKLYQQHVQASEMAYRQALKAGRSGAFEWNVENDHVTWSEETGELLGVDKEAYPQTLKEFLAFVPEDDRAAMVAGIHARLASDSSVYEIENRLLKLNGTPLWVRGSGRIERDASGKAVRLVGLVSDIDEIYKARSAASLSEARLRRILDNVAAVVATLTTAGVVTEANELSMHLADLAREDVVGKNLWDCYWFSHSTESQRVLRDAITRAAGGERVHFDAEVQIGMEQLISVDFHLAPIFDEKNRILELVASGVDITDRKRSEAAIQLLMREVVHRSKNLLGVVHAIARQTARGRDPAAFVGNFSDRLMALSASHDLLVKNEWRGIDLDELVRAQLGHFQDLFNSRVFLDGNTIRLSSTAAQGIGMALHELATNAAKYGALSNDAGRVRVRWKLDTGANPHFSISWIEDGGPRVKVPITKGFGHLVMGSMAEATLHGQVAIAYAEEGISWILTAPAKGNLDL